MTEAHRSAARILWNYLQLNMEIRPAELIFVMGSNDPRVAETAAHLYLAKFAPKILFSGGIGRMTRGWTETEAEKFANIAMNMGVPKEAILVENKSTNSGENISFSRKLLEEQEIQIHSIIALQKPYMERRAFATLKKQWPEVDIQMSSPQISYEDGPTDGITEAELIHAMVGDYERILKYPDLGFQIPQETTVEAQNAFEYLLKEGYTEQML